MAAEGLLEELKRHSIKSLNTADYDLRTALHLAVCNDRKEIVEWLLHIGVDRDIKDTHGNTPLDDAINSNNYDIIQIFRKFTRLRTTKL